MVFISDEGQKGPARAVPMVPDVVRPFAAGPARIKKPNMRHVLLLNNVHNVIHVGR